MTKGYLAEVGLLALETLLNGSTAVFIGGDVPFWPSRLFADERCLRDAGAKNLSGKLMGCAGLVVLDFGSIGSNHRADSSSLRLNMFL